MHNPEVYADITFIINFIMDFLILWATARLAKIPPAFKRIGLAALLGGIYAVGYLLNGLDIFYCFPAKIIFSCLMILIAMPMDSWDEFKKVFLFFYAINFTVAGASIAFSYFIESEGLGRASDYLWLVGAIVAALVIGVFGGRYISRHIVPSILRFGVQMRFEQKTCSGKGFLDTGNSLRDPLTNKPVIVAEYEFLKDCLPEDFKKAIESQTDEQKLLDDLIISSWSTRMRLIPFTSIGKKHGMLIGVRADEVKLDLGNKPSQFNDLVVGIYRGKLTSGGKYQMLIPTEMVES